MAYFFLNSFREGTASTLIGRTSTPLPANWSKSSENAQSSAVQTLVKANGKKASSTWLWPRKDAKLTGLPEVELRVKSGATSPATGTRETVVMTGFWVKEKIRFDFDRNRVPDRHNLHWDWRSALGLVS